MDTTQPTLPAEETTQAVPDESAVSSADTVVPHQVETADQSAGDPLSHGMRAQFAFAAVMWTIAALILGVRGAGWLVGSAYALPLFAAALVVGELKYMFVMAPVSRRIGARIRDRGPEGHPLGFFSWRSWGVVALMVAAGHALRLTAVPRLWLGVLYVAVAAGLALGSRAFWRVVVKG